MEQTANVRFKLTVSHLQETGGFLFSGLPFSGGFVFGSACVGVYPQFSGVFVFGDLRFRSNLLFCIFVECESP